ncbi:MAG: hypothetical protein JWN50_81 [Parcubacteria group bacterium]|nr:hypothetical protein [Parcubacteria group bacterium]
MQQRKARYDDEITKKEWRTKEGQAWVWRMVATGKRIAIVRWRWKWFPWFRIAGIIRQDDGGDEPVPPDLGTPEKDKRRLVTQV